MNSRRDFLKLLTAAAIAASAGLSLTPEQREVIANHKSQYLIGWDAIAHRFEVRIDGDAYYVEALSRGPTLTEREIKPMMASLLSHVRARHGEHINIKVPA